MIAPCPVADELSIDELHCVARLALGRPLGTLRPDWTRVLELAIRERCAPLAWLRSAGQIRDHAPAATAASWRAHAFCAMEQAHAQAAELVKLVRAFGEAGLSPIVLKGLPLSVLLHGDVAARPAMDTDLFLPIGERQAAHVLLLSLGWRHLYGSAPEEGSYQFNGPLRCPYLELHSSVLDENLWSHVALTEPEVRSVSLDGATVPAQDGPLLPVFLAAHLAKHAAVPLLWWVDFHTLWNSLTEAEQDEARRLAAECGLGPCLAWAIGGTAHLERAAVDGTAEGRAALRTLRSLHDAHNARRVASLAGSLVARSKVWAAWAWPRYLRRRPLAYGKHLWRRGSAWLSRRRTGARTALASARPEGSTRVLEVHGEEWLELLPHALEGGGGLWIRARGTSMLPTIPPGSLVHLVPVPPRPLAVGDVVLAQARAGRPLIHRIVEVGNDTCHLKGDNRLVTDPPVPHARVLALVESIRTGDVVSPMPGPPTSTLKTALSRRLGALRHRAVRA